ELYFETDGLGGLYGGLDGTAAATRRAIGLHRAIAASARVAIAPTRFAARLAAELDRPPTAAADGAGGPVNGADAAAGDADGPAMVEAGGRRGRYRLVDAGGLRRFLSPVPVSSLVDGLCWDAGGRRGAARTGTGTGNEDAAAAFKLVRSLERLGLGTLGRLAELPADSVADRFGRLGLRARSLARGEPERLRPRPATECLEESADLSEALDGSRLEGFLELLIDRVLARPERDGRTLRSVTLSAELAAGGSWCTEVALNVPSASAELLRLVLVPRLVALPGPAASLTLRVRELGDAEPEQGELLARAGERRRGRIGEAVQQARAAAGPDSVLRVLSLDPDSRLPERRVALSPYEVGAGG
ncbi:MAG TPA: hypothetical protein VFD37_03170, partial [Solirubrobacterales bacterium]|nr:hypothetical protein [Solirubrobacterales bacterium]